VLTAADLESRQSEQYKVTPRQMAPGEDSVATPRPLEDPNLNTNHWMLTLIRYCTKEMLRECYTT
jgi:hypothetical protein